MSIRPLRWLGIVVVAALAVTGCSKTPMKPEEPHRKLVLGATAEPTSMDPSASDAAATSQVLLYNVYETLVKLDGDGKLKPLLASSWDVSPDRLTYTFELQQAHFASERKVTPADVVWSINRVKEQGTKVQRAQLAVVDKVEPVDDDTVKVVLNRPSNAWLYDMSGPSGIVYDSQATGDLAATPAGSGPFALKEWRRGASVELEKNTKYWGTPARFDDVVWRYFSDANALNNAMLSGDLDILTNVQAPQALPQFSDASRFTVLDGTTNGEVVMGMNNASPVLADAKVRKALTMAIDRKALVQTVWAGKGELIGSMVPPTDPWYEDLSGAIPFDPEGAKALLAEAGQSNPTLRLRLPTLPYATAAGQFIASQLKDVGVTVVTDQLEFPAQWVDQVLLNGDYDLTIVAHVEPRDIVKFADPTYYWHYDNPEFQALVKEADAGPEADYAPTMKKAAKILSDDAAADFLFLLPNLVVTKADVTGVNQNATSTSFDLTTVASRR